MIFLAIGRDCPFKSMALLKNKGSGQFESLMEFIMLVDTTMVNSIDLRIMETKQTDSADPFPKSKTSVTGKL